MTALVDPGGGRLRVLPGPWAGSDDGTELIVERWVRPRTFNSMRVKPTYGRNAGKQMAARAHEMVDEVDSWCSWSRALAELSDPRLFVFRGGFKVDVHHLRVNHAARPDVGSPYVAAKAVIDGLAAAGVLPNGDGPAYQRRLTFHPYEVAGCDGLRVTLTALPGAEQAALDFT